VIGALAGLLLSALVAPPVVERDVAVPMRDGVVLRADVLRPSGPGPFPVLVYRTPYGKGPAQQDYGTFAHAVERGYAMVVQDVRGRYASAGEFNPYQNEGRDGYDTIEWAAAQPWSNGAVGTFGLSYPGAVQWLAAVESPPHLKAMVPAMTFSTPRNFFHSGGVFDLSWIPWIWENIAPDVRVRKQLSGARSDAEAEADWKQRGDAMRSVLPLQALPDLRDVAPYYYEWMRHPPGDPWWAWCEIRGRYERVTAAVLNLSGWHDDPYGPEGAVTNYQGLLASRAGASDPRTRLLIGPWVHGVGATGETRAGDREFGPAAAIDYDDVVLTFLDRYVRGLANRLDAEAPVRVFVMGENAWHALAAWPQTTALPLYLSGAARRGALLPEATKRVPGTVSIRSDPARPVTDPFASRPGAHDYRALAQRRDVAVFETPPLDSELSVLGPIQAELHVSVDAPDTDLWVKVEDVAPDGTAWNLMSPGLDVLRASYRNGGPQRELLEPGRIYPLRLSTLFTGSRFLKGHRIRVVLTTTFMPHFSRNLHTGELETDSARMRKAVVRIHFDAQHASRLTLPVLPEAP
jgi:putative CocE/NonD family hydrolase